MTAPDWSTDIRPDHQDAALDVLGDVLADAILQLPISPQTNRFVVSKMKGTA